MDSLKRIVSIMNFVEENVEQLTEDDLKAHFKEDGFHFFSRYCLGGKEPYAQKPDGIHFSLTQTGVRKLHELRQTMAEEKRNLLMTAATIVIAIFTVVSGIGIYLR